MGSRAVVPSETRGWQSAWSNGNVQTLTNSLAALWPCTRAHTHTWYQNPHNGEGTCTARGESFKGDGGGVGWGGRWLETAEQVGSCIAAHGAQV